VRLRFPPAAPSTSPTADVSVSTAKKINFSTVFAGQAVGIKELEEGIWRLSFMDYDLGYIDVEEELCRLSKILLAQKCKLCLRYDL